MVTAKTSAPLGERVCRLDFAPARISFEHLAGISQADWQTAPICLAVDLETPAFRQEIDRGPLLVGPRCAQISRQASASRYQIWLDTRHYC
jgi:hypothetical protein